MGNSSISRRVRVASTGAPDIASRPVAFSIVEKPTMRIRELVLGSLTSPSLWNSRRPQRRNSIHATRSRSSCRSRQVPERHCYRIVADAADVARPPFSCRQRERAAGRIRHPSDATRPDGYTAWHGSAGTHMENGAVHTRNYNVLKDFEPVALLASTPQLIVAKNTCQRQLAGADCLAEVKPDMSSQGTAG